MERDVAGVRLAVRSEDCHTSARRDRCSFAGQPALTDAGRPDDVDHTSSATDGLVQDRGKEVQFRVRPIIVDSLRRRGGAPQWQATSSPDRNVRTLDLMQFVLAQHHRVSTDAPSTAEHDRAWLRYRFHPLSPYQPVRRQLCNWQRGNRFRLL